MWGPYDLIKSVGQEHEGGNHDAHPDSQRQVHAAD